MENSEAFIEIEQMKEEEDQNAEWLEKVHDYYEKSQDDVEELRLISEKSYEEW